MSGSDEPGTPGEYPDDAADEATEESMAGFRRKPGGISARFTAAQSEILRNLIAQVAELIAEDQGSEAGGEGSPPPGGAEAGEVPLGMEDLAAILGEAGPTEPPTDPVLARLFPDAYQSDSEAAGEFRRFTEHGLRSAKIEAAQTVLAALPGKGGRVRLSEEEAQIWLRALNDVRLALGVRLGITEDHQTQAGGFSVSRDDPRAAYAYVYDWLTFLQETLVHALS